MWSIFSAIIIIVLIVGLVISVVNFIQYRDWLESFMVFIFSVCILIGVALVVIAYLYFLLIVFTA